MILPLVRAISIDTLQQLQRKAESRPYAGPRGEQRTEGDERIRLVRDQTWRRPASETFDEFLVVHLKYALGTEWGKRQVRLPRAQQHVVIRWMFDASAYQRQVIPNDHQPGDLFTARPSGDAMELHALAEDVYRLSLVEKLPRKVCKRLRQPNSFQGARYELALAAAFTRAGFRVEWLKSTRKHGEFTIALPDGEAVLVEAKSRHRQGRIHQPGRPRDTDTLTADVDHLYKKALEKETDGLPFLISIDVNIPLRDVKSVGLSLLDDVRSLFDRLPVPTEAKPAKEFCLCFTNFNWHYSAASPAPGSTYIHTFPEWTVAAAAKDETYVALLQAFKGYGKGPEGAY